MAEVERISQETHNRFLNFFTLGTRDRVGNERSYYMASRAKSVEDLDMSRKQNQPDGVVIFSLYGEKKDRVVLVHQFRYPINGYIYELPAGLVEKGEDFREAAVREMREETGLTLHLADAREGYERPFYSSCGMTDESCCTVYGTAEGTVRLSGLEDTEQLDVVLADRAEVRRILREENVAANCAYLLMQFLHNQEDPLAFLKD